MRLLKIITLLLFVNIFGLNAQNNIQDFPHYSQYYFHKAIYNPAYIGYWNQPYLTIANQWQQEPNRNTPVAVQMAWNSFIPQISCGVGLSASYINYQDDIKTDQYLISGQFMYEFEMSDKATARLATSIGALHYANKEGINGNNLPAEATIERYFKANLDIGAMVEISNFNIGFSVVQASEPKFNFYAAPYYDSSNIFALGATFDKKGYVMLSYLWDINENFSVEPHVLFRQFLGVRNSLSQPIGQRRANAAAADFTLVGSYQKKYFLGGSMLYNDRFYSAHLMAALKLGSDLRASVSYDMPQSIWRGKGYSKFEIGLSWWYDLSDEDEN
ncbi:MAG: type IX secretion system membrane protein PorP/SprF [Chitinophagales bacterium]|nr:type IX secretion system membrane protein PorP/SprF [Bacteroidota bacterium]MCB9043122.1 type IX secretion system membrane protein PorP/SprF [Chitinophagales bacterium]